MDQVYEGVVHWADVIVIATPIRWGGASSLYYKMIERMNCIQNQETHRQPPPAAEQGRLASSSPAARTTCRPWPGRC